MTIAQRLYALIFAAVVGLIGISCVGLYQIQRVYTAANYANVNTIPSFRLLDSAYTEVSELRTKFWQYLALREPAQRNEMAARMAELHGKAADVFATYERDFISDDMDRQLLKATVASVATYDAMRLKALALANEDKNEEARDMALVNQTLYTSVKKGFEAHLAYNSALGKKGADEAMVLMSEAIWQLSLIAALVSLATAVAGLLLVRKLSQSFAQAILVAQTVAAGDLTSHIDVRSKDEIGQLLTALKAMNDSLVDIVGQVRAGTETVATASGQIASGNHDLSSRTEEQAASLEETASSMEELTSTVRQNADNARQANSLSSSASEIASRGSSVVAQVVETMNSINDSSKKIADIISVIDGIAFQTNILALNAAVEAARAGEQGRGFAVVASEVRNLAQRSAGAAKEIKALINDSAEKVDAGSRLAGQAGSTMDEVVSSARHVTDIMAEIMAASQEQTLGIEQINQAIIQMDSVTQQNSALVEEASAAAESLQDQAAMLAVVVSHFKFAGGPATIASQRPAPIRKVASRVAAPARVASKSASVKLAAPRKQTAVQASGDWEAF
ncbi:MAG: methyl-accepting chemotaxis protein [Bradyrhizobium sp.]|jgi:methyl-accepting chemotaxis protein